MNDSLTPTEKDLFSADSTADSTELTPGGSLDLSEEKDEKKDEDDNNDPAPEKESFTDLPEQSAVQSFFGTLASGSFITNLILAGLFSNSIFLFYTDYDTTHRFSSMLMMIQVCCITLFFLIRVAPSKVSMKPLDWTMAVLGTCLPMLLAPVSAENEIVPLMLTQFFGIFMSIVAIVSLNTSFAVVPALRNIKTGGLYSLIRHPIYFSYFLAFTCIALQNFSITNMAILIALYAVDIYRIIAEENLLSEDPNYARYKMQVRYRLVPLVW